MKQLKVGIIYAVFMMLMVGCSKDVSKPNDENEHEAINKIELVFAETSGATTSFVIEDPDGDGGNHGGVANGANDPQNAKDGDPVIG